MNGLIIRRMLLWRLLILSCLVLLGSTDVQAFVATTSGSSANAHVSSSTTTTTTQLSVANNLRPSGVTSGLIATLAEQALKLRLKGQAYVKFDVTASSSDMLLQGRVGPVSVRGRSWQSPRGLTCRAIEAKVGECALDMSKIVAKRKLLLLQPALGESFIAMNAADFGNFLVHPLIRPPHVGLVVEKNGASSEPVQFSKEQVRIDPATKTVHFRGEFLGDTWEFALRRGGACRAVVSAKLVSSDEKEGKDDDDDNTVAIKEENSQALAQAMTNFFNHLEVELDGTFLSYKDMSITSKGASPSLMLKLGITVYKFPAPGVPF